MNLISKTVPAIAFSNMLTLAASAEAISGGKVTSVNAEGKSFRRREKTSSLSDLKTGQPAKVEFQRQGESLTALLIGIGF